VCLPGDRAGPVLAMKFEWATESPQSVLAPPKTYDQSSLSQVSAASQRLIAAVACRWSYAVRLSAFTTKQTISSWFCNLQFSGHSKRATPAAMTNPPTEPMTLPLNRRAQSLSAGKLCCGGGSLRLFCSGVSRVCVVCLRFASCQKLALFVGLSSSLQRLS